MTQLLGGGPKEDKEAKRRQAEELARVTAQEEKRKLATARSRRGRASLISGEETGISTTLGG